MRPALMLLAPVSLAATGALLFTLSANAAWRAPEPRPAVVAVHAPQVLHPRDVLVSGVPAPIADPVTVIAANQRIALAAQPVADIEATSDETAPVVDDGTLAVEGTPGSETGDTPEQSRSQHTEMAAVRVYQCEDEVVGTVFQDRPCGPAADRVDAVAEPQRQRS
ncbi:hypothetical protein N8I74_02455 [Chitiniphilus purpureus]|uniref:DUF4124 domain-containing protein n=1 Tax=Chitiniphilus purpureus TaxID=2981137 RepID=A0ABY6DVL5_9NEIS|nr:hypothetical protein [Chitiniphilus sp. CD1]UXY15898.1 hypothetical protein N8I74_02455 [Chitiniphilus sp. CD1]